MNTSTINTLNESMDTSFHYPSNTDKKSLYSWSYGGTFITPWVASFRNQRIIDSTMNNWRHIGLKLGIMSTPYTWEK